MADTVVPRSEVYAAIDSERNYQDIRWNEHTTSSKGQHTLPEWILYIEDYVAEARHQLSRHPSPQAEDMALHTLRKITAMGVAAMEQLGAPHRD